MRDEWKKMESFCSLAHQNCLIFIYYEQKSFRKVISIYIYEIQLNKEFRIFLVRIQIFLL